jgi:hypothetical protein
VTDTRIFSPTQPNNHSMLAVSTIFVFRSYTNVQCEDLDCSISTVVDWRTEERRNQGQDKAVSESNEKKDHRMMNNGLSAIQLNIDMG